jgi:hypothetical protein
VRPAYIPKIEYNKPGFEPGRTDTNCGLALPLEKGPLEFLVLAGKVPPKLKRIVALPPKHGFYSRS